MDKKQKDIKDLIDSDEDFIYCPRWGNSLKKIIEKHPDGLDDDRISKVLLISVEEVRDIFESAIKKIRKMIGIE